ncbi:RpnC/YadD family protein [Rickettsia endosymbiont of Oedothorax gibbosus]|uniref:transposase n=1 Tax=Rickettsia endosymbiont of Oedothorax gibbosus TaxID=931099 RepID=UPI0020244CC8|nr:transposase [Rickettsia endosymbiont of Oedothorax gibbosus]
MKVASPVLRGEVFCKENLLLEHIHKRDMIKLWEEFLQRFKLEILVDKENGYIYLRSFLWYTDAKLPEAKQSELEEVLAKYLSEEEQGVIMRTIAQKYIEEGEARGIHIGKAELVKLLLKNGNSVGSIAKMSGMSINKINELLKMQ